MGRYWLGLVATTFVLGAGFGASAQQQEEPAAPPAQQAPEQQAPEPGAEPGAEAPHPIEPILVQGYVKTVSNEQLTLTAPGAPVDLPLSLREETRYIQGENDVKRSELQEGQLVRAALLPVGEDLVALVVEVMPEEPQVPEAPGGEQEGLQGEQPPAQTEPIEPQPSTPPPSEPAPMGDEGTETQL